MDDSPAWTLGNLRLDPDRRDRDGVLWFLAEEEGFFGAPATTGETAQRLNAHGGLRRPGWKTERTISLKGYAFAPDYPAQRRAVHQITALASEPDRPITVTCHSELGDLSCEVWLDDDVLTTPLDIYNPGIEFSVQVIAPDPRKYGARRNRWRADLPAINTGDGLDFMSGTGVLGLFSLNTVSNSNYYGLDFDDDGGLKFGESNATGIMQLANAGTAPSWPVYTLYGPLQHPVLTAVSGGQRYTMRYEDTLSAGQRLVIDPTVPSVLLGGEATASRRHLLNPAQFSGFAVPGGTEHGGTLSVGLTHEGPSTAAGYVTATVRDAWW